MLPAIGPIAEKPKASNPTFIAMTPITKAAVA